MKKTLLLLIAFSCFLSATLFAQIPVLTNDNASPKPGDSYLSQPVAVANVPMPAGGANKTWTYSNLVDSGTAIGYQAVLPSATPFADSFPGSNVVVKTAGDSLYVYFNATPAALLQTGIATSDSTILRSTPARTYVPYPFTYGSAFVGPINQNFPGYNFTFTGTDNISGDGYGTLVVSGKTYSNVLRIHYIEDLSFNLDTLFSSNITNIHIVSYLYYTPDTHAPLFSDETSTTHVTSTFFGIPVFDSSFSSRDVSYLKAFVLPVTFQSFKASLQNKDVSLQWKTAQEINTDHFTIQRSLTGRDFQNVASVKATGSGQGSLYNYTDKSYASGNVPATVYYRIQEVDKDGKQTLSSVALVHGDHAIVISVYPNPASNAIHIAGNDVSVADLIAIYDTKGSLLMQWRNYATSQPVTIASLTKGTYLVKVTINGKTTTSTIVKQ